MKFAYMLVLARLGLSHMMERPLRTLLTVVGVALGVSAFIAVRTANIEVLRSFEQSVSAVSGQATLEVVSEEGGLDEAFITDVRSVPGVQSSDPVLVVEARLAGGPRDGQAVTILGVDLLEALYRQDVTMRDRTSGGGIDALTAADSLFLGKALAAEWDVTDGDRVQVQAGPEPVSLRVAGVIEEAGGVRSRWSRTAVMDIAAAQKTFGLVGQLDRIELVTVPSLSLDPVQAQLERLLPPSTIVQRPETRGKQVENMVRAFQTNLMVLSMVGLLVGVFLIYNTISFSVIQRRREIGIFRAIGMSEGMVSALFVSEAAAMGLVGGLAGALMGVSAATALTGLLGRTVSDLYASVPGSFTGRTPIAWLPELLLGAGLGATVSALGAVAPSIDAGRTLVVQALAPGTYDVTRQSASGRAALAGMLLLVAAAVLVWLPPVEGIPVFGYAAAFCLLAGLSGFVPFLIQGMQRVRQLSARAKPASRPGTLEKIAVEQIARASSRSSVTVSALLVGVAIMVGVVIMIRSFRHTVEVWIEDTVIADLIVTPQAWLQGSRRSAGERTLPSAWAEQIRGVQGVAAVDSYRDLRIRMGDKTVSLVSRDLKLHAERSRYLVLSGDSSTLLRHAADRGGVLLSEVLAEALAVDVGRSLELPTPGGPKIVPVVGIFYDYATDGGKIVMDRITYRSWWSDDDAVTVFPVYLTPDADPSLVREAVLRRLDQTGGGPVPSIVSNAELRREILEIFDRTFLLTYALELIAVSIAILGIVNTLVTSVLERRREFATLQAIGASQGQVQLLVLWEALYLAILGSALGVVGGVALSFLLIKVINKQSFGWTIQIAWTPQVWGEAVVVSLAVALLSGYWPARWASRQPPGEGLRYE